jgi:hypothetical protein
MVIQRWSHYREDTRAQRRVCENAVDSRRATIGIAIALSGMKTGSGIRGMASVLPGLIPR